MALTRSVVFKKEGCASATSVGKCLKSDRWCNLINEKNAIIIGKDILQI